MVKHLKDNIKFKFQFFIDIANILAPFLNQFQTNVPVMPFMDEMLASIIHRLMKIFLLRSVVNDVVTSHQLIKLDVTKKGFLPQLAVKLPTASKALLSTLEISRSIKIKLIYQCVSMVKTIVLKLQERSPLKYLIVRCSSCLVPRSIVNESESVILQFNKVVDKLFKQQQLKNKEAGEAKLQFKEFVTNYVPQHSDKFNSLNVSMQRLDKFYGEFLQ